MKRRFKVLLVSVAVAAMVVSATGAGAGPFLTLVRMHPLVVRGAGFHGGEHVQVTVYAKITRLEKTTATSGGTFRSRFRSLTIGHCTSFRVTAVGSMGSRATLKRTPLPACLPD